MRMDCLTVYLPQTRGCHSSEGMETLRGRLVNKQPLDPSLRCDDSRLRAGSGVGGVKWLLACWESQF